MYFSPLLCIICPTNLLLHDWITLRKNITNKNKTIILFVYLYGCETWFLILREEDGLKVFENRVLRRIFGPKRESNRGMEKAA
jgi:hypothetical protein